MVTVVVRVTSRVVWACLVISSFKPCPALSSHLLYGSQVSKRSCDHTTQIEIGAGKGLYNNSISGVHLFDCLPILCLLIIYLLILDRHHQNLRYKHESSSRFLWTSDPGDWWEGSTLFRAASDWCQWRHVCLKKNNCVDNRQLRFIEFEPVVEGLCPGAWMCPEANRNTKRTNGAKRTLASRHIRLFSIIAVSFDLSQSVFQSPELARADLWMRGAPE